MNWAGEIVDLGSEAGVIEKSGAHYPSNGERIADGRDACASLVETPKVAEEIRAHLVERRKADGVA